jgi:hypothetical protein
MGQLLLHPRSFPISLFSPCLTSLSLSSLSIPAAIHVSVLQLNYRFGWETTELHMVALGLHMSCIDTVQDPYIRSACPVLTQYRTHTLGLHVLY